MNGCIRSTCRIADGPDTGCAYERILAAPLVEESEVIGIFSGVGVGKGSEVAVIHNVAVHVVLVVSNIVDLGAPQVPAPEDSALGVLGGYDNITLGSGGVEL